MGRTARHRGGALFSATLLIAALCLIPSAAYPQAPQASVAIYYYERMPFFGNPDTPGDGFILRITKMIFDEAGIPYRFEKMPVLRMFETLKRPGVGCFAGLFRTPEREALYRFSSDYIYRDEPPHFVVHRRTLPRVRDVKTIKDLMTSGLVLGAVDGYSYGRWVDGSIAQFKPKREIVSVGDDQANFFRMLQLGRFDYLFSGLEEAMWNLRANPEYFGTLMIRELADAPEGNARWLVFSRDTPDSILRRIDAAVAKVKAGAAYRAVVEAAKK